MKEGEIQRLTVALEQMVCVICIVKLFISLSLLLSLLLIFLFSFTFFTLWDRLNHPEWFVLPLRMNAHRKSTINGKKQPENVRVWNC